MAAQGAGDSWWAGWVGGLTGAELDPLEALSAKNMEALQHPGAFVMLVVFLVTDGTLHIHGFPSRCCNKWATLLESRDHILCHDCMFGGLMLKPVEDSNIKSVKIKKLKISSDLADVVQYNLLVFSALDEQIPQPESQQSFI